MNYLDFFFIVSGTLLFFLALDVARKQRLDFFHLLIFVWAWVGLLVFTFFPQVLDSLWNLFGIPRGADVLVYLSIVFLTYFVLLLLWKHYETKDSITQLIRSLAIEQSAKRVILGREVFVIPSYNEGKHLFATLQTILGAWYENIIVVNDGSRDATKSLAKKFDERVIFLHHLNNRGQGSALETGFEYLRRFWQTEFVVTFDADGQHCIEDLPHFYQAFTENPDLQIVFGSRFLWEALHIPTTRKLILKLAKIFTRCMSSWVKLTDTHNGFRVFRSEVLETLTLKIDGMAHASEFIDIVSREKLNYSEVPITIRYTDYSLEKWQSSRWAIGIALRFLWTKFFR